MSQLKSCVRIQLLALRVSDVKRYHVNILVLPATGVTAASIAVRDQEGLTHKEYSARTDASELTNTPKFRNRTFVLQLPANFNKNALPKQHPIAYVRVQLFTALGTGDDDDLPTNFELGASYDCPLQGEGLQRLNRGDHIQLHANLAPLGEADVELLFVDVQTGFTPGPASALPQAPGRPPPDSVMTVISRVENLPKSANPDGDEVLPSTFVACKTARQAAARKPATAITRVVPTEQNPQWDQILLLEMGEAEMDRERVLIALAALPVKKLQPRCHYNLRLLLDSAAGSGEAPCLYCTVYISGALRLEQQLLQERGGAAAGMIQLEVRISGCVPPPGQAAAGNVAAVWKVCGDAAVMTDALPPPPLDLYTNVALQDEQSLASALQAISTDGASDMMPYYIGELNGRLQFEGKHTSLLTVRQAHLSDSVDPCIVLELHHLEEVPDAPAAKEAAPDPPPPSDPEAEELRAAHAEAALTRQELEDELEAYQAEAEEKVQAQQAHALEELSAQEQQARDALQELEESEAAACAERLSAQEQDLAVKQEEAQAAAQAVHQEEMEAAKQELQAVQEELQAGNEATAASMEENRAAQQEEVQAKEEELQAELQAKQEELQAKEEELQAELQAKQEELQAKEEELQATQEEMQASKEETEMAAAEDLQAKEKQAEDGQRAEGEVLAELEEARREALVAQEQVAQLEEDKMKLVLRSEKAEARAVASTNEMQEVAKRTAREIAGLKTRIAEKDAQLMGGFGSARRAHGAELGRAQELVRRLQQMHEAVLNAREMKDRYLELQDAHAEQARHMQEVEKKANKTRKVKETIRAQEALIGRLEGLLANSVQERRKLRDVEAQLAAANAQTAELEAAPEKLKSVVEHLLTFTDAANLAISRLQQQEEQALERSRVLEEDVAELRRLLHEERESLSQPPNTTDLEQLSHAELGERAKQLEAHYTKEHLRNQGEETTKKAEDETKTDDEAAGSGEKMTSEEAGDALAEAKEELQNLEGPPIPSDTVLSANAKEAAAAVAKMQESHRGTLIGRVVVPLTMLGDVRRPQKGRVLPLEGLPMLHTRQPGGLVSLEFTLWGPGGAFSPARPATC
eukprot:gene1281-1866_t